MFSRLLSMPILLGAAVGVPYIATHGPSIDELLSSATAKFTAAEAQPDLLKQTPSMQSRLPALQGSGAALYPSETPLEGLPGLSLHEVFNTNVTKEWVYQHWARKSTALSELGLFGIRVPLVTGTQVHDLAGSLTYFFGKEGRVQRISFHGTTGDTAQIVMLMARQYGLQQQVTPVANEQLFQIRRQNQVFSELRTRPASVLWTSSPHDSFTVDLDLQSPNVTTPLPSRWVPLPVVKDPPLQQPLATSEQGKAAEEKSKESWKAFFPRSRVPKKQIDSLDRRSDFW